LHRSILLSFRATETMFIGNRSRNSFKVVTPFPIVFSWKQTIWSWRLSSILVKCPRYRKRPCRGSKSGHIFGVLTFLCSFLISGKKLC
jgi:hypothetical protein